LSTTKKLWSRKAGNVSISAGKVDTDTDRDVRRQRHAGANLEVDRVHVDAAGRCLREARLLTTSSAAVPSSWYWSASGRTAVVWPELAHWSGWSGLSDWSALRLPGAVGLALRRRIGLALRDVLPVPVL